jgi:hypothetical protein
MAKERLAWVIHWHTHEYGGLSTPYGDSYHLTREDADAFKAQREGDWLDRGRRAFEDGYYNYGSEPAPEVVPRARYKRIQALGPRGGFLGP